MLLGLPKLSLIIIYFQVAQRAKYHMEWKVYLRAINPKVHATSRGRSSEFPFAKQAFYHWVVTNTVPKHIMQVNIQRCANRYSSNTTTGFDHWIGLGGHFSVETNITAKQDSMEVLD